MTSFGGGKLLLVVVAGNAGFYLTNRNPLRSQDEQLLDI